MPWKSLYNRFLKKPEEPLLPITEESQKQTGDNEKAAAGPDYTYNEKVATDPSWNPLPTITEGVPRPPEIVVTRPPTPTDDHDQIEQIDPVHSDHATPADYEKELARSAAYRKPGVFSNPFDDGQEISPIRNVSGLHQQLRTASQPHIRRESRTASQPHLLQATAQPRNFSRPSYASASPVTSQSSGHKITWLDDPNTFGTDSKRRQSSWGQYPGPRRPSEWGRKVSTISTLSVQSEYPRIIDPVDPARKLSPRNLFTQRIFFLVVVAVLNIGCLMAALFSGSGLWVFVFILVVKSKDVLSAIISPTGMMLRRIYRFFKPPKEVSPKWILSLIPAYSESEEQIVKCIFSLRDNGVDPHRQVMCVILDGKPRDVKSHYTELLATIERPYVSFKHRLGELRIHAGFMKDVPVIIIEKKRNAGKKDSLILAHDLFNYPRQNVPLYTELLREEIWQHVLPDLTDEYPFQGFDMVFCTDADSVIHQGALASLCNALAREENSIAACGLVLVELEPGREWSGWNLYQQFQVILIYPRSSCLQANKFISTVSGNTCVDEPNISGAK